MHHVYILLCGDGTLYCGYAKDIEQRLKLHLAGKGARYTRGRSPLTLVYSETFTEKGLALKREYQIKQLSKSAKLTLIRTRKLAD